MSSRLMRLYPAAWRARYGEEFEVVLEARRLRPFDVADVVFGAFDARVRGNGARQSADGPPVPGPSLRIGGYAAVFGGILWAGGLLAMVAGDSWSPLGAAGQFFGTFALIVAIACLGAFQARRHPFLVWSSVMLALTGAVSMLIGMATTSFGDNPIVGPLSGWALWFLGMGTMILGAALFGFATIRVGSLSRRAAGLLVVGSVLLLAVFVSTSIEQGQTWFQLAFGLPGIACTGAGWVLLGLDAYRRDPLPADHVAA